MSYAHLYKQATDDLKNLKRSTSAVWLDRYVRFIVETGKREEFMKWVAKDLGLDQETICRLFPAESQEAKQEFQCKVCESDWGDDAEAAKNCCIAGRGQSSQVRE